MNEKSPEGIQVPECESNNEISICLFIGEVWNRYENIVDKLFTYYVALQIIKK